MEQHGEPSRPLDEGPYRRAAQAQDEVAFPMSRDSSVRGLGRSLAHHELGRDERLASSCPGSWHTERTSRTQARCQFATKCASALNVERLVNGLVRDPHRFIFGEVESKSAGDLLGAPRLGPSPVLPATVPSPHPPNRWPRYRRTIWSDDRAGETVLHVGTELIVRRQLRHLRAAGPALGMPLGGRRPIDQLVAAGRGVAAQLT